MSININNMNSSKKPSDGGMGAGGKSNKTSSHRSMCSSELGSRVEALRIQLEEERKRRLDVEQQIQHFVLEKGGPQAAAVQKIITEHDLAAATLQQQKAAAAAASSSTSRNSQQNRSQRHESGSGASENGSSRSQNSSAAGSNNQQQQQRQFPPRNLPPMGSGDDTASSGHNDTNNNSSKKQVAFQTPASTLNGGGGSSKRDSLSRPPPMPPSRHFPVSIAAQKAPLVQQEYVDSDVVAKCESEAAQCERLLRQLNHSHATVLSRKPSLPACALGVSKNKARAAGCDYVMARRTKATPAQLYVMNEAHQQRVDKINAFTMGISGDYYR